MNAHTQGCDAALICNKDVCAALTKECEQDIDNDAVHLARAAEIVRRDMLKMKNEFVGSFNVQCQGKSMPVLLLALVSMVLHGTNTTTQTIVWHLCLYQL